MESDLPRTKADLIERIQQARADLDALVGPLSEAELSQPGPDGGWAVRDHLMHLAEWRWKLLAMMRGRPGYEGLQIDPQTYATAGVDRINAILYERNQPRGTAEILADYHRAHQTVLEAIQQMDESDLRRPYDLTDYSDPRLLMAGIAGNTYEHDAEHLGWIRELLGRSGQP